MLFFSQTAEPHEPQPLTFSKRDKFRKEIRRNELRGRFKELRAKLLHDLNSQNMMETLAKLKGCFNQQEFREAVCSLEKSCESTNFNNYAVTNKLQAMLLEILKNQEHLLTRTDASRVLCLLSILTYYSLEAVDSIIKQQDFIVDHLRKSLEKLEMSSVQDVKYFNQAISILLNLSASFNSDFNKFLVQSGYCSMVNRHLARTIVPARESDNEYYKQLVIEARVYSLKLFKNIVQQQQDFELKTADLVREILLDEQNMKKYPYNTLLMLAQAMQQGQDTFWRHINTSSRSSEISSSIYNAMIDFQERWDAKQFPQVLQDPSACLTQQQKMNFFAQASFLNQLYYMHKAVEIDFQTTIENLLNGYMLAQFIIESDRDRKHQHLIQGIKLLYHLSETSDVTAEQLLIIRPADDPLSVLKVIMQVNLLTGIKTGKYCLVILINLLRKDFTMLKKLMELNLIDKIHSVLQIDWENAVFKNILMTAMELTTETLLASKSTNEEERVYGKMQQVGVLNLMQRLQEHRNRDVYVKAEHFMHVISDYKTRHN